MGNKVVKNNKHETTPKKGVKKPKYTLRVLTLGISGSGKTTFAKQMKIIHQGGFAEDEVKSQREILLQNVLIGMQELVKQAEKLEYQVEGENRKHCRFLTTSEAEWNEKIGEKVKILWQDPAIQKTWAAAPGYQLQIGHMDYLMENLERITKPDFIPTNDDVLRARQRTTGEQTTALVIDKVGWEMIDVGGQRPERSKWESILMSKESINAIIFFGALDEFNMASSEEADKTKMELSIQVFHEVLDSDVVKGKPSLTLLLFLNKTDLLESKLKNEDTRKTFKDLFPNYNGTDDSAHECIKEKFISNYEHNVITTHYTCALDTEAMGTVFTAVRQTIFDNRLSSSGVRV